MIKLENWNIKPMDYSDASLNYVDQYNRGDVLLLHNPTTENPLKYKALYNYSIKEIKAAMTPNEDNVLYTYKFRHIGNDSVLPIIQALDMYTAQIEKNALLTDNRVANIFKHNLAPKISIIDYKYAEVIAYLLATAENGLIWHDLSDTQKRLYLSSVINNKKLDKLIKERVVRYISEYITLEEANKIYRDDYKVLKRFIK